ncbi:TEM1 [Sanghuangporus sanghuang]
MFGVGLGQLPSNSLHLLPLRARSLAFVERDIGFRRRRSFSSNASPSFSSSPGILLLLPNLFLLRDTRIVMSNQSPVASNSRDRANSRASASSAGFSGMAPHGSEGDEKNSVVIKVGMVGDSQIGKTSLMVKYVEGSFDEDYIQTLGVNFMEKTISVRRTTITFSIWDLGGQREFVNMLPLVCNDAVAILFMFDLSRKSTLNSVKEWYRQARGFNKTAIPFLIGTKYDVFATFPRDEQEEITKQAKKFAKAMRASLIFCSTSASINVQKIFKIVLAKAFDLKCVIPEIEGVGEPILLYMET